MVLFWIFVILGFIISVWAAIKDEFGEPFLTFLLFFMISGMVFGMAFLVINGIGSAENTETTEAKYPVNIVSLNDGSQIEGKIYGGLFVMRGQVGETQYFSYYRNNGNGSYSLDKREADKSVIIPDATPETAHVDVTDSVETCKPRWWLLCDGTPHATFAHAEFHVPANSIKNDFVLDAQ